MVSGAGIGAAGEEVAPDVRVALLASHSEVAPESDAVLALRLDLPPDFHSYWISPGASGMPMAVVWGGEHVRAIGPINWPLPRKTEEAGDIHYIYEGQVVLAAPLRIPAHARPGNRISVEVKVEMLVCKDACHLVTNTARLDLPVAAMGRLTDHDPFGGQLYPSTEAPPFATAWDWSEQEACLKVKGVKAKEQVDFYPLPSRNVIGTPTITRSDDGVTFAFPITFAPERGFLPGCLVAMDHRGRQRRAWLLENSNPSPPTATAVPPIRP